MASIPPIDAAAAARFWARVERTESCWWWLLYERWSGRRHMVRARRYAVFNVAGKVYAVHRLAYLLVKGPIPDGLVLLHTCDNPACVNPAHLIPGTQADNVHDMIRKKRASWLK